MRLPRSVRPSAVALIKVVEGSRPFECSSEAARSCGLAFCSRL